MSIEPTFDDELVRRLPLPLAQLYRRAFYVKTTLDRHNAAYCLWEAALKLLGSVAIVTYAERGEPHPDLFERLRNLARPALGHWWEFVRLLVPVLAEAGDPSFRTIRDLLLGRARDDLPRAAGLDAALRDVLEGSSGARVTVRLSELFERLVRYRNLEIGHGAPGQRAGDHYERVGRALLLAMAEVLGRLDVLAGRRLIYIADVRRLSSGSWLVERYELAGESARRLESLERPADEAQSLPHPGRLYLESPGEPDDGGSVLSALHPLAIYEPDSAEVFFLNARRGETRTEYLCYHPGRTIERRDLSGEQRDLLARVLGAPVDAGQQAQWASLSQAEEPPSAPPTGPARRRLGEFELLSELGRGGMGVVYRAWQPSLGRQVALKSLLRAGDPKAEARFNREIHALGRVEHPHLVKVFTSGLEDEHWFYAMELVEGATLAAVCGQLGRRSSTASEVDLDTWRESLSNACQETREAERPLRTEEAQGFSVRPAGERPGSLVSSALGGRDYIRHIVELMRQVAEAAHALHEAGVIHRDIKPENILVTPDGRQGVLMDLGLAQLADETEGRLTRTRQFVGTLRYASPEQVLSVPLDRRSDVYSLGATLWELLTLRPLFGAGEQMPTPELMLKVQSADPDPPRRHNLRVPADLEAIVLKCLEKDRSRRYATATDMASDLRRFQAGEPVEARRIGSLERGWRWCRRNPKAAITTGLVAICLFVATIVSTIYARERGRFAKDMEKARLRAEAAKTEALHSALHGFHLTAETSITNARMHRPTANQRARSQALESIRTAAEARRRAADALVGLGPGDDSLAEMERRIWARRVDELRDEAVWWLTRINLTRVREIPVTGHLLAVEPRSCRVAVLGGQALEIFDDQGRSVSRLPIEIPALSFLLGEASTLGMYTSTELAFSDADHVEVRMILDKPAYERAFGSVPGTATGKEIDRFYQTRFRWSLSEGRLTQEKPRGTQPPAHINPQTKREIAGSDYVVSFDQNEVNLRPHLGGPLRKVWRSQQYGQVQSEREVCKGAVFLTGVPRALLLLTSKQDSFGGGSLEEGVVLVDVATGLSRRMTPSNQFQSSLIDRVQSLGDGFLTLERVREGRAMTLQEQRRLVFWSVILPTIKIEGYQHDSPPFFPSRNRSIKALALGTLGLITVGYGNQSYQGNLIRSWRGQDLSWSSAQSGWNFDGASIQSLRTEDNLLVIRKEPRDGHDGEPRRLEVYSARDGQVVRSWPLLESFNGRVPTHKWKGDAVLRISPDRRIALAGTLVGEVEIALHLISLDDFRTLGTIGTFALPWTVNDGRAQGPAPIMNPGFPRRLDSFLQFSPDSRWLLIRAGEKQRQETAFWSLAPLKLCGKARNATGAVTWLDESVLIGSDIFDLTSGALKGKLEQVPMKPGVNLTHSELTIARFSRWLVGFYKPDGFGSNTSQCVAWDSTTGKSMILGASEWSSDSFGNPPLVFVRDDKLFILGKIGPFFAEPIYRAELWDLHKNTLVHREESRGSPIPQGKTDAWDGPSGISVRYVQYAANTVPPFPPGAVPLYPDVALPPPPPGAVPLYPVVAGPSSPAMAVPGPLTARGLRESIIKRWSWTDGRIETVLEPVILASIPTTTSDPLSPRRVNERWGILMTPDFLTLRNFDTGRDLDLAGTVGARGADWFGQAQARMNPQETTLELSYRYSPPGETGTASGSVMDAGLWDVRSGQRLATIPAESAIQGFDSSGHFLLAQRPQSRELVMMAADSGKEVHRVRSAPSPSGGMLANRSGDRLFFVSRGILYFWDAAQDHPVAIHRGTDHAAEIQCLAHHQGLGVVASGDANGVVILRDASDGHLVKMLIGAEAGVDALAFSSDGRQLATASSPRRNRSPIDSSHLNVVLWDTDTLAPLWTFRDSKLYTTVDPQALVNAGKHLLVGTSDGRIIQLDAASGKAASTTVVEASGIRSLAVSPRNQSILVFTRRGKLQIRDSSRLALQQEWDAGSDVEAATFLTETAIITAGQSLQIRAADSGQILLTYEVADGPIRLLSRLPGSMKLAYAGSGSDAYCVDLSELQDRLQELDLAVPGLVIGDP